MLELTVLAIEASDFWGMNKIEVFDLNNEFLFLKWKTSNYKIKSHLKPK